MPDKYQLSTQIDDLYRRLAALEAQVSALSSRLGVPFSPASSGAIFDPGLGTVPPSPQIMDPAFDPMLAPVPPPAPDPSFGAPSFGAPPVNAPPVSGPLVGEWPVSAPTDDPLGAGLTPEIIDLVRRGRKIEAIKLYRSLTGLGLKDAKNVIDNL